MNIFFLVLFRISIFAKTLKYLNTMYNVNLDTFFRIARRIELSNFKTGNTIYEDENKYKLIKRMLLHLIFFLVLSISTLLTKLLIGIQKPFILEMPCRAHVHVFILIFFACFLNSENIKYITLSL